LPHLFEIESGTARLFVKLCSGMLLPKHVKLYNPVQKTLTHFDSGIAVSTWLERQISMIILTIKWTTTVPTAIFPDRCILGTDQLKSIRPLP